MKEPRATILALVLCGAFSSAARAERSGETPESMRRTPCAADEAAP
jgi:hypothetical protein